MKYLICNFLLLLGGVYGYSQTGTSWELLDEAEEQLQARDLPKAKALYEQCYREFDEVSNTLGMVRAAEGWGGVLAYEHKNDSALLVLYSALPLAKQLENKEPEGSLLSVIGTIYGFRGQHEKAKEVHLRSSAIYRDRQEWELYSSRLLHLSSSYQALIKYDSAEYWLTEAIRVKEEVRDSNYLHIAYSAAALFYELARKEYGKAISYYLKAIEISEVRGMHQNTAQQLANLANYLEEQGQYEKSKAYATRAIAMMDTLGLRFSKAVALNTLGELAEHAGDLKEATNYYNSALDIYKEYENEPRIAEQFLRLTNLNLRAGNVELADLYLSLGKQLIQGQDDEGRARNYALAEAQLFLKQNRQEEAEPIFRKAIKDAESSGDLGRLQYALKGLSEIVNERGAYQEAYNLLLRYGEIQDSIAVLSESRYAAQLEAEYERSQKDEAINELQHSNEIKDIKLASRNKQVILLMAGVLVAVLAAFLGFFLFNSKRRNARVLEEKNRVIAKALSEKDLLLREIHHRVKNNLQVISSLLSLQSRFIKDPQAISAINEGRSRVRSMALIHQNLYQEENITGVQVREYFTKLLQELFDTYKVGGQVDLETDIQELNLDVDTIIPIGLILNELVSNALKYAFPEGEKGQLKIALKEENEQLVLEVIDTGIGIEEPEQVAKSATFGYRLINSLAAKLKAELKFGKGAGTSVSLHIKEYRKAG